MGKARRDAIDAEVTRIWPGIVSAQESFRAADPRGKCAQLTSSKRPADKPSHRPHCPSWDDLNLAGIWGYGKDKLDGEYWMDEYDGPRGKAFALRVVLVDDDGTWTRNWYEGQESWQSIGWSRVV